MGLSRLVRRLAGAHRVAWLRASWTESP